jgi:hypothetical protein
MRGVFLPAGEHSVEFKFAPSLVPLYITLAALLSGVAILVYVWRSRPAEAPAGEPA